MTPPGIREDSACHDEALRRPSPVAERGSLQSSKNVDWHFPGDVTQAATVGPSKMQSPFRDPSCSRTKDTEALEHSIDQTSRTEERPRKLRRASFGCNPVKSRKGKERAVSHDLIDLESQQDLLDLYHDVDISDSERSVSDADSICPPPRRKRYMTSGLSALTLLRKARKRRKQRVFAAADDDSSLCLESRASSPASSRGPSSRRSSASTIRASLANACSRISSLGLDGPVKESRGRNRVSSAPSLRIPRARQESVRSISNDTQRESVKRLSHIFPSWRQDTEKKIKLHIQRVFLRQRYIVKLCKALMKFGAPSHRMEEYIIQSASVLELEVQVLYLPECMIVSFDDSKTHTADVRLVRCQQGIALGRLSDTHEIYKEVVHDVISVQEACERLDEILRADDKFPWYLQMLMFGFASVFVGLWAFGASWKDCGPIFVLASAIGLLRLKIVVTSGLYSDVFEVLVTAITSFIARWLGSIRGQETFCFSAIAQSSIILILPGYLILMGSLELQAHSLVSGAVRLIFALIVMLFLQFAIMVGSALYGLIDENATTELYCAYPSIPDSIDGYVLVPLFTFTVLILNNAKWKQMPLMMIIACVGYHVQHSCRYHFTAVGLESREISSALGAFAISVLANLWSRISLKVIRLCMTVWRPVARLCYKLWHYFFKQRSKHADDKPKDRENVIIGAQNDGTAAGSHMINRGRLRSGSSAIGEDAPNTRADAKVARSVHINFTLAAAAMLPGIFVLLPAGLAIGGSLSYGLDSAEAIAMGNTTFKAASPAEVIGNYSAYNISLPFPDLYNSSSAYSDPAAYSMLPPCDNGTVPAKELTKVLQICISISVGLFLGSLVVYPFGKGGGKWGGARRMRSGLFSF